GDGAAGGGGPDYAAAARTLQAWLADGTLQRDPYRSVYRYHQIFRHADLGPREITRVGFIAAVRLHDFAERVVLPHEQTMAAPKADRLELMQATAAHLSPIFTLYRDAGNEIDRVFKKTERDAPVIDARTADGTVHRVWRTRDAEVIGKLRHLMAPKKLYIADGHHRYETMLAYRDQLAAAGALAQYASAQYGLMFMAPMDQHGMVVLPTHRVVHGLQGFTADDFLTRAREQFIVEKVAGAGGDPAAVRAALAETPQHQPAVLVAFPGEGHGWRLTLAPQVNVNELALGRAVNKLDVTVLHTLILERLLGLTPAQQQAGEHVRYVKDTATALAQTATPGCQAVFLMNPVPVDKIKAIADAGEVMPQKTTYFYPKLASGLVVHLVERDVDLI
ncbi:MAG: DUF1015 domain-containing protein, partial [Myxococcales bacterium]|nr:DUF1015 domain-containing protein [Myxococcales bacterium]